VKTPRTGATSASESRVAFGKRVNSNASSVKSKATTASRKSTAVASRGGASAAAAVSSVGEELMSVPEEDCTFEGTDHQLESKMEQSENMGPYAKPGQSSHRSQDRKSCQTDSQRMQEQEESKRVVKDIF